MNSIKEFIKNEHTTCYWCGIAQTTPLRGLAVMAQRRLKLSDDLDYAFFGEDGDIVSVFVTEKSLKDLGDFFEEQYEDDDKPISKFAEDIGLAYYDHDGVEMRFQSDVKYTPDDIERLFYKDGVGLFSYFNQFESELLSDLKEKAISASCVLMLYGFDYRKTKHYGKKSSEAIYIGTYEYQQ
jgi:hypothetical protein